MVTLLYPEIQGIVSKFYNNQDDIDSNTGWLVMKLIMDVDKFNLSLPPMNYIYRVTRNYCIDEYRKTNSRKKRETIYAVQKNNKISTVLSLKYLLTEMLGKAATQLVKALLEGKNIREACIALGISKTKVRKFLKAIEEKCRGVHN